MCKIIPSFPSHLSVPNLFYLRAIDHNFSLTFVTLLKKNCLKFHVDGFVKNNFLETRGYWRFLNG